MENLKQELDAMKIKNRIMVGAMSRMNQVVQEMQEKVNNIESEKAKRMMLLSGFSTEKNRGSYIKKLANFFRYDMGVEVQIEDCYTIGERDPKQLVITFQSVNQKKKVFQNISRVKDLKMDGKRLIFKDYLLNNQAEKKKREEDIIYDNERKPELQQLEIEYGAKGFAVARKPYRKKVLSPDPVSILAMEPEELDEILAVECNRCAKSVCKQGNTFIGYAVATNDLEVVRKTYMHIKLANASARHIVCAWNLIGSPEHEYADFQDDGDYGAGRAVLDLMLQSKITSRAIFVVRYTAEKLGADRYKCYEEAVKLIMQQAPYNRITQMEQKLKIDPESGQPERRKKENFMKTVKQWRKANKKKDDDGNPRTTGGTRKSPQIGEKRGREDLSNPTELKRLFSKVAQQGIDRSNDDVD